MAQPLLSHMRETSRFMRAVATLVIIAFSGLVTAPAAAAVRQAAPLPAAAAPNPSAEAEFAKTVARIEERLARLETRLARKEEGADDRAALKQLVDTLKQLDKRVSEDFSEVGDMIKAKKLPALIQKRHDQAVSAYQQELAATLASLAAVEQAADPAQRLAAVKKAHAHLKEKQFRRSHQPFDPNDLNPVFKADPTNRPRIRREDYVHAGLYDNPLQKLAALGDFKFDGLAEAGDPAYLAETPEVTLTQAIRDKAAELNHDPVTIYHWVRNNVEWLPTWGAYQSADLTLSARRGNALDIASLTIALLRASGIPARYAHGAIDVPAARFTNWAGDFGNALAAREYASVGGIPTAAITAGGTVSKVRLEHIWVEAAIDYLPSRGAVNREADTWVALDPSFKQYDYLQGLDVAAVTGIDGEALAQSFLASGTVNEAEGWVQGFDPSIVQNAQSEAQQKLQDYIANNMTDPTVGEVIGGRRTIVKEYPTLPSALPNHVVITGKRYAALPDPLRHTMTFAFGRDILGELNEPLTLPWATVNNARLTLSFRPATEADEQALLALLPEGEIADPSQLPSSIPSYLVSVVPELKLDGQLIKSGSPMKLGEELDFVFQARTPLETQAPYTYKVIAGSYLAIAAIGQGVGISRLNDVKARLEATKTTLESQDQTQIAALTREDILGDMFHAGVLGYFAEYGALSHLMALQQRTGHSLAIGYGSYGYEPNVDYFFGFPRAIESGGVVMNVRLGDYVTSHDNDPAQRVQFRQQIGMLSSALEHAIPEQMFVTPENPGEAISAVKALAKATAQGQRIYHITQENMATALPNIHHDADTMDEIRAALAVGKEVITHTDAVTVPGWKGAGYIIMDPDTGVGAYKIGGGMNGGNYYLAAYGGANILGLISIINILAKAPWLGLGPFVGAAIGWYLIIALAVVVFATAILSVLYDDNLADVSGEIDLIDSFRTVSLLSILLGVGFLSGLGPLIGMLFMIVMLARYLSMELVLRES